MMPIGGTKKPPMISPTETKKQMAKVTRDSQNDRVPSVSVFILLIRICVYVKEYASMVRPLSCVGLPMGIKKGRPLPPS